MASIVANGKFQAKSAIARRNSSILCSHLRSKPRPNWRLDPTCEKTYAQTIELEPPLPVLTASAARANLYRLIDQASESHQPITIAGKNACAVLVSAEDWSAIQETMHLLSVPGMRESIRKGMAEPLAKCARKLNW
jgi:antitoxin YefM